MERIMDKDRAFPQELKDGTYQVHLPLRGHGLPHVVKGDFATQEAAERWISSEGGRTVIAAIIARYEVGRDLRNSP
jgi:hypothetical protein